MPARSALVLAVCGQTSRRHSWTRTPSTSRRTCSLH